MKKIIDFISDKVQFINLNELEIADNKMSKLGEMGFEVKEKFSYAIQDSIGSGQMIIEYVKKKEYPLAVHLCTAKLKDKVQLTQRIKRESKNAKKDFDIVNEEGLLSRGALYLKELSPGFGYRDKLEKINKDELIDELQVYFLKIKEKLKLDDKEIFLDEDKPRILLSVKNAKRNKKIFKKMGLLTAIVKEYPTADQLEIEVEFV